MSIASEITAIAAEYDQLKKELPSVVRGDNELPEELLERQAYLVRKLIAAEAASELELAYKALITLDWIVPVGDIPSDLALSLCRDVVRMFPPEKAAPLPPA